MSESDFSAQRKQLVGGMKSIGSLQSSSLEKAFLAVPREKFFDESIRASSYADSAFPIGSGQTISQPSTISIMLEMLGVQEGQRVLEVGAGSGYVAALLSELVGKKGKVFGVELVHELHQRASRTLLTLGYENIQLKCSDGTLGWKAEAPFDRIIISAACSSVPLPLIKQLKGRGKLVAPVGGSFSQEMLLLQKEKGKAVEKEKRCCFVFVPLRGKFSD